MPNYLWLGIYSRSPAIHSSSLCLTYDLDPDTYATVFSILGTPPNCVCAMQRSVALKNPFSGQNFFASRVLIGIISDNVLQVLGDYIREVCSLLNDTHGRPIEDWTILLVRSFEDSRFIPTGAIVRAQQVLS